MEYLSFHSVALFALERIGFGTNQSSEPFLENMMGLVSPFAGVHNLDLSPDSSSDATGSRQIWALKTPSDGPFAPSSISDMEMASIRAYGSEAEM